jgi:hypothetical protein
VTSPFRDATLSPAEVRRVLKRIAEKVERPMTRTELEAAALELGLTESAIASAFDQTSDDDGAEEAKGSWFLGGRTRISMERELPCEPTQAQREDLLDELREAAGDVGTIESLGNTLVWHATPSRNAQQSLSVRMRFRDGRTRIVIEERLLGQAIGLFVGLGVGGGIGPMGAYIALITKIGLLGLVAPLIWIPMMLLLARTIFARMTQRRVRTMNEMMKRIERHAAGWQGTRIAVAEAEPLEEEVAEESADKIKSGRTH